MSVQSKARLVLLVTASLAMMLPLTSYADTNAHAGDGHHGYPPGIGTYPVGAYRTGVYPNMFAEAGYSQSQINAKVNAAWNQFFHGDPNTQAVYYQKTPDMAYIEDIGNGDVRTEGIGYGMMIAVQLNHRKEFDSLWNFAKTYMQIKSGPTKDYFAWHTDTNGKVLDYGVAPDGDQWIAASLAFAAARWGNGPGIYNYRQQADQILHAMWHNADNGGVNMFSRKTYLPTFSPPNALTYTDPSYSLPAFYRVFASVDPSDRWLWDKAYVAGENLLKNAYNTSTGLAPDYSNFNGTPYFSSPTETPSDTSYDHTFQYDAWRAIANANIDAAWFGLKPWEVKYSDTLEKFFAGQGISNYESLYHLNGTPISSNQHSTGLVAMNASSAIAATNKDKLAFVNALWNTSIPSGHWRYYDGMLYTLGMLYDSGKFRMWWPPMEHREAPEGHSSK